MRLTLRTVLAYLEDALPPENARRIGRMIGRSPAARRIVARIRKVVRRRRLIAVKPDSDSKKGMDANDMSEYLDNTLPEEQLHRVERRCLKHDALLAEAAACHQILSRVLGETPPVNESARLRAYSAVGVLATSPTDVAVVGSPLTPAEPAKIVDGSRTGAGTADSDVCDSGIPRRPGGARHAGRFAVRRARHGAVAGIGTGTGRRRACGQSRKRGSGVQPKEKPAPAPAVAESKEIPLVVDRNKNEPLVVLKTPEPKKEALPPAPTTNEPDKKPSEPVDRKSPPKPPTPAVARVTDAKAPVLKAADYTATSGVLCRLRKEGPERLADELGGERRRRARQPGRLALGTQADVRRRHRSRGRRQARRSILGEAGLRNPPRPDARSRREPDDAAPRNRPGRRRRAVRKAEFAGHRRIPSGRFDRRDRNPGGCARRSDLQ